MILLVFSFFIGKNLYYDLQGSTENHEGGGEAPWIKIILIISSIIVIIIINII